MIKNGLINLIGQAFKVGSSVLVIPFLIKFLGLHTFGLLSWSTAILGAIQLAEGGLGSGLLYFLSDVGLNSNSSITIKKRNQILSSGLFLLSISTFIVLISVWLASPYLVKTIDGISIKSESEIELTLKIGSFLAGFRIIQNFFWAILQSQNRYETYSLISTLQIIFTNILWAALAFYDCHYLPTFLLTSVIVCVIFSIFLTILLYRLVPNFNWNFNKSILRSMISYNLGVWGSNIGSIMFSQGDKIIVANIFGVSILGIYTIFTNITTQLNQFTSQAVHPILPMVSGVPLGQPMFSNHTVKLIKKYFLLNIYISLGGAGLCIIFASQILTFFLKNNFQDGHILQFQILSFIYGAYNLSVTGYYIMLGRGRSAFVMAISFASSLIVLTSMYFSGIYIGFSALIYSNSLFVVMLVLLQQGMHSVKITIKDWFSLLFLPLVLTISLTISSAIVGHSVHFTILSGLLFILLMAFKFFKDYRKISYLI